MDVLQARASTACSAALAALDAAARSYRVAARVERDLIRAGGGDDQGLYLFVPWLAHVLGWRATR